jgi:hypothetical protein
MKLADAAVAELYNADRIVGEEPKAQSEGNFLRMENPYSLSDEGPKSMFKQAGGGRRSRRVRRKRKATKRRGRRHH